jgi:hypothetical protein
MLLQEGWVDDGVHAEECYTSKPRESFVRMQKTPYKGLPPFWRFQVHLLVVQRASNATVLLRY